MLSADIGSEGRHHRAIKVREVGLRDGLQSLQRTLPTGRKMEWISRAYDAGVRSIEVGSFVPAKLMPQLADTAELVSRAKNLDGLQVCVLVPNLRGAEAAFESGADLLVIPLSASHKHSLANLRRTPDEVVADIGRIRSARDRAGSDALIECGLATAFGCTIQGRVESGEVLRLVQAALEAGADQVSLADTVGYADPASVRTLFESVQKVAGGRVHSGHFHDTRGLALANVCAAMEVGINSFDSSLGGLGGCPHAPGASGNVATEDLVFMIQSMGLNNQIDLPKVLELRSDLAVWLDTEPLYGAVHRAGLPKTFAIQPSTLIKH